jgi:hypothetical protein
MNLFVFEIRDINSFGGTLSEIFFRLLGFRGFRFRGPRQFLHLC